MVDLTIKIEPTMAFGIVTYNVKYWECDSFCTLIHSYKMSGEIECMKIYIIDNTEIEGWFLEEKSFGDKMSITYVNLKNPGISTAYNLISDYALRDKINWIVFFDQDTILPLNTYKQYHKKALENDCLLPIKIPFIYSLSKVISPCLYKHYRSYPANISKNKLLNLDGYTCINSGLMIETFFFKSLSGYNKDLKLDFCDHDFIERAKKKVTRIEVLDFDLEQNFSSDTHNRMQAAERYLIFCKDLIQFI